MFISPTWLEPSRDETFVSIISALNALSLDWMFQNENHLFSSLQNLSPFTAAAAARGTLKWIEIELLSFRSNIWNAFSQGETINHRSFLSILFHFPISLRPPNIECCTSTTEPSSTHKYLEQLSIWTFKSAAHYPSKNWKCISQIA